jgi:hypothetical protein
MQGNTGNHSFVVEHTSLLELSFENYLQGTTNKNVSFVDWPYILTTSLCLTSALAVHRRTALPVWENTLILFYPISVFPSCPQLFSYKAYGIEPKDAVCAYPNSYTQQSTWSTE